MLKENKNNKLKVDIFVPLNACSCQWEKFMNLVFTVLNDYRNYVKFETKNLNSQEARKLNLRGKSIVIDGKHVFTNPFALKKELPEIIREKGLK